MIVMMMILTARVPRKMQHDLGGTPRDANQEHQRGPNQRRDHRLIHLQNSDHDRKRRLQGEIPLLRTEVHMAQTEVNLVPFSANKFDVVFSHWRSVVFFDFPHNTIESSNIMESVSCCFHSFLFTRDLEIRMIRSVAGTIKFHVPA